MTERVNKSNPHILFLAPQTCRTVARTGIQRVVMQAAQALLPTTSIDFVKWDSTDGQLRYFNSQDLDVFFQSRTWPASVRVNRFAERRRYRFDETIESIPRGRTWLFMPEISYHMPRGAEIYASILAQAREYGIRTATVFYDLIPITNTDYQQGIGGPHTRYVHELFGVDLILPISAHSATELVKYQDNDLGISASVRQRLKHVIEAVPLATVNADATPKEHALALPMDRRDHVVLLGTVEPRKRQVEVVRAFKDLRLAERFGLQLIVIGSLHPQVTDAFRALVAGDPNIVFLGYANEEKVKEVFSRARFSVFASNDEGFGLPICESLAHGVPCLAANFGSMKEVGEGGGCLLVDVNDQHELGSGLERLASNDALIDRLRSEIAARRFRTWNDYAQDVLTAMENYPDSERDQREFEAMALSAIRELIALRDSENPLTVLSFENERWAIAYCSSLQPNALSLLNKALKETTASRLAIVFGATETDNLDVIEQNLVALFRADVWTFRSASLYERMVSLAHVKGFNALLPTRCAVVQTAAELPNSAAQQISELAGEIARRHLLAAREQVLSSALGASAHVTANPILHIIISTYNRAAFVAENVRWLSSQLVAHGGRIKLTVVDNASTDDTEERLAPFAAQPHIRIVRNSANVGMLGNLRVCAALSQARHTWLIGDDDFIVPSVLEKILATLQSDPYLTFAFINFGVYHRESLGPDDYANDLIRNPIQLTQTPSPTGRYPIREIAIEHDNLFTAIYPIVFRTDVLLACFNYPFDGVPFGSLTESIPTTKIILESYAETEAFWISEIGIVGNAHNSWQRYRVQWHGVIMPLVFEKAREGGVKADSLHTFSRLHKDLYSEAKQLFPDQDIRTYFEADALQTSFRIFGEHLR